MAERRAASTHRFDTIHSPRYDENWGTVSPSHAAFVARLAGLVRQGGAVLDAACGTGKYWPALLAAGLRITGVDQSAGMLAQAHRKFPEVPTRVLALQDLAALPGRFDGLLCVDALEYVAPEDWAVVTAGLARVLRPPAPAYVTVELPVGPLPPPVDPRQLPGEVVEGGGYHYYPPRHLVRGWLEAAGFTVAEEADADSYWHLLLTHGAAAARPGSSSSVTRVLATPVPSAHRVARVWLTEPMGAALYPVFPVRCHSHWFRHGRPAERPGWRCSARCWASGPALNLRLPLARGGRRIPRGNRPDLDRHPAGQVKPTGETDG